MPQQGPLFYAAEVDLYQPASTAPVTNPGRLARPRLALALTAATVEVTQTLRTSDVGYRTPAGDPAGSLVYPPRLETAFELDRALELPPDRPGVAVGWGALRLSNADGELDGLATQTADARAFRILAGRKTWDATRELAVDPLYSVLASLFAGVATSLRLGDGVLEVGVRDASYWLERPLQNDLYTGGGGLTGTADMAGRPKPKLRGGSVSAPVRFVAPVLVDPTANIYQYTDAAGQVVALYEGGLAGGIVNAGDVANLYSGSVAGGYYRTDNARGLLQLGAQPVRPITLDALGKFPSGSAPTTAAAIALALLQQDIGLPSDMLDAASFTTLDAAAAWPAGWYWDGATQVGAVDALGVLLVSLGAKLLPTRSRALKALALRLPDVGATVAGAYGTETIVGVRAMALPAGLSPPVQRARVGYGRTHTVQQSDIAPTVTAATRQRLSAAWQYAMQAAPAATLLAYRRPNEGTLIETALSSATDAATLAAAMVALWGVPRLLFAVTVPLEVALRHDLGDLLRITYPVAGLAGGALGRIVGEQLRSRDGAATLTVLF